MGGHEARDDGAGPDDEIACPACRATTSRRLWTAGDRLFRTTRERFEIRRCAGCAVLFLWPTPTPEQLAAYYPDGYWAGPEDRIGGRGLRGRLSERYRRFVLRDHVRFVARIVAEQQRRGTGVRLLDIGCGDGSVLEACAVQPSVGLDWSLTAARAARARGLDVLRGELYGAPFRDRTFSLITMFHVLEHVASPDAYLRAVKRLLTDDGDLVVQVPNVDSWQAAVLGGRWAGLDVPRHLVDYSPVTLRALLARSGFSVVRETQYSLRDNPTTLANSLVPRLYPPGRVARKVAGREAAAWTGDLAYLAVTLAAVPVALVESLAGCGASVMIQARPEP